MVLGTMLNYLTVAMPNGNSHGWGIAGSYISKGLKKRGAEIWQATPGYSGIYSPMTSLQAISGPEFGLTANVIGSRSYGYGFIESNLLAERYVELANRLWDYIIPGSTWMYDWLRGTGFNAVKPIIQGVDPELFYLNEHSLADPDYFTVGSFGKFEYRKGQDIVIKALSIFCERRKDVKLLYAWKNNWPNLIRDMAVNKLGNVEVPFHASDAYYSDGHVFKELLEKHKIPSIAVPLNAQYHQMSEFYDQCDVALFPGRSEAGQALPLQECLDRKSVV